MLYKWFTKSMIKVSISNFFFFGIWSNKHHMSASSLKPSMFLAIVSVPNYITVSCYFSYLLLCGAFYTALYVLGLIVIYEIVHTSSSVG